MPTFSLDALDLAALLCSKVCHDVISPVGAIINGLEVLEEEKDAEMRKFANDLIRKSAHTASAKLQFCRLAFGAAGSAGASIDTRDAGPVARQPLGDHRLEVEWGGPPQLMPKNQDQLVPHPRLLAPTGLVARACDMHVEIAVTPEKVSIDARPATMAAAA